jgi:predicted O-methyltransferase YrrM
MSDQSQPERARLQRVDLPAYPGDEGPVRRAMRLGKIEFDDPTFRPATIRMDSSVISQTDLADGMVLERWRAHRTGLAPYYPLLYSLVIGMGAQRVFEFGHGESSLVLQAALVQTGGHLVSCGPATGNQLLLLENLPANWTHHLTLSEEALKRLGPDDLFDLVLHDGSHSADVVAADLKGILPRMRSGGLVLVHDLLHSYVGKEMGKGVMRALDSVPVGVQRVTLPFAFGLQILQTFNTSNGPVSRGPEKASSPHHTMRMP